MRAAHGWSPARSFVKTEIVAILGWIVERPNPLAGNSVKRFDHFLVPDAMKQRMVAGSAESVAEQIKTNVFDAGIDGVIINMPTSVQGYQPGAIAALGKALKSVLEG